MKIVILGNMGYVGPLVVEHLRMVYPTATLVGYDAGFFASSLTRVDFLPERLLDLQYFGDVRNVPDAVLENADIIVNLAAISNDPMGNRYEEITMEINHTACIRVAKRAKALGVKSFVFASSCSIYGTTHGEAKENSNVNPLTAYARSKVYSERDLRMLSDENFVVTCLRFATACGMSPRLRLDLVLNDFVASAQASGEINILSDGTPWRPLINVKDMALAIDWAIGREPMLGDFLALNVGHEDWNYQVKQLAEAVAYAIPGVKVSTNAEAPVDKRSYRVNFDLFKILAPKHQPRYSLINTIKELNEGLEAMNFKDMRFRESEWIRLNLLTNLQKKGLLNDELRWKSDFIDSMIAA